MRIIAYLFAAALLCGASSPLTAGQADDIAAKETAIVVLSFMSPTSRESAQSYNYTMHKNSKEKLNYPLPLCRLPEQPVLYGKDEFIPLEGKLADAHAKQIKKADFDVIMYDMLPIPDYNPGEPLTYINEPFYYFSLYKEWIKAAEKNNLKICIFADIANQSARYPKRRSITGQEWVKILTNALKLTPDSPAVWKIGGKPVVIHFGTDSFYGKSSAPYPDAPLPDCGWRQVWQELKNDNVQMFFISDIRPHAGDGDWNDIAEAAYMFAPAGPENFMYEYQTDIAKRLTKIPFFWTQSSGYYRRGTSYTQPDFARIHNLYMAAIKNNASKVITMTYNDLGEDHDIWPSANKGSELLDITGFYNLWFKTSKMPEITAEKIVVAYPLRAPEVVSTKSPNYSGGKWVSPGFTPKMFYWSLLKQPRIITLNGKTVTLAAGVAMGEVELEPGDQQQIAVSADINGQTIQLPPVKKVKNETDAGGLEHRYLDLLAAADNLAANPKIFWDVAKDPALQGTVSFADGVRRLDFALKPEIHNWVFARNTIPGGIMAPEMRFLKLTYRGSIPAGAVLSTILQQTDGGRYEFKDLPQPEATTWTEVIVPLAQFEKKSPAEANKINSVQPDLVKYGHVGVTGRCDGGSGFVEIKNMSFIK